MEKTLKINVPDGYEFDKKKSTSETIVFKKIDDVVFKWNVTTYAVEINADGEHFMVDVSRPSYCCSWDDAMRFHRNGIWYLPTVKQLQVLVKYFDDINAIICENGGYKITYGWHWSCEEKDESRASSVAMSNGNTSNNDDKGLSNYARAVCAL